MEPKENCICYIAPDHGVLLQIEAMKRNVIECIDHLRCRMGDGRDIELEYRIKWLNNNTDNINATAEGLSQLLDDAIDKGVLRLLD